MTFEEWQDQFYGSLLALLGAAIGGTMQVTTAGLTFGGYVVHAKQCGAECVIWVVEDTVGASSVDEIKWQVQISDDPFTTANKVADWLRPRVKHT